MKKIIETTLDLVKIPSVSGNVGEIRKVLDYVKNFYKQDRVIIREFEYENSSPVMIVSNVKTDDFDLLIVGHLDVVPAKETQFVPKIEGNRLYARGAADMKSQIAIGMHILQEAVQENSSLKIGLLITTDEETSSNGIKSFKKNEKIRSKIVLDVDAGDIDHLVEKHKHSVGVRLYGHGVSGHSSRPWQSENAVDNLIDVIAELRQAVPSFSIKANQELTDTWINTMAVTYITAEKTSNVIPELAEANLNFRLTETLSLEELKKLLDEICQKHNTTYDVYMASCGCYMDANSEVIQNYKKIAEKVIGHEIGITHMNGATDARMFADYSTIIMHSINGENIHGIDEYVEIDSVEKLYQIQKAYLKNLEQKK